MLTFIAIPLTLWLAALVATPRRPLQDTEVTELVYVRLLGRQQRLILLAILASGVALLLAVALLPERIDPDLRGLRESQAECISQMLTNDGHVEAGRCEDVQVVGR
jgi:hypothetical protein